MVVVNSRNRLLHLHHFLAPNWKVIYKMFSFDQTFEKVYSLTASELSELFSITSQKAAALSNYLQSYEIQFMLNEYQSKNVDTVTMFDKDYPHWLKMIPDPPWVIYLKGDRSFLIQKKLISIVGTRVPSSNGYKSTDFIVQSLVTNGWTIVSGLAKGIDFHAHRKAIETNGRTVAVLGFGFDHMYPVENRPLAEMIAAKHLLLTEFPPSQGPQKWHFPLRNRIISGLSLGTVVIEAKERSGSLITADQALEQNREVFAVPGSIFNETSIGTNRLIQQGAKLVIDVNDIFTELVPKIDNLR